MSRHQTDVNAVFRDRKGRFTPGNPGGPGNPLGPHVARLRAALLEAVTPADMHHIARILLSSAKAGDIGAIKLLLERVLGKPLEADLLDRIEVLENTHRAEP